MGQITFNKQNPKYCNLVAITTGSKANFVIPDGEIWMIDSTNSNKGIDGKGKYDYYIIGDGNSTASQLVINKIKIDDTLNVDAMPTMGSVNPVSSGGVYQAIQNIVPLADDFGDNEFIGINQKALTEAKEALENSIDRRFQEENRRATAAETAIASEIQGINRTNIVILGENDTFPSEGQANTIYRKYGVNSYTDSAWNGTNYVILATYNNALDEEPTQGSNNLITSGSVYAIKKQFDNEFGGTYLVNRDNFDSFNKTGRKYIVATTGANSSGSYAVTGRYYVINDYIDVSNITQLSYYLRSRDAADMALLAAYNEDKEYIMENSIISYTNGLYKGIWTKGETTKYIRFTICYNSGTDLFFAYDPTLLKLYVNSSVDSMDERIDSIENGLDFFENNLEEYSRTSKKYIIASTGNPSADYGEGGRFYISDYIDVTDISSLSYRIKILCKEPVAGLAAYDANKTYLPENSVILNTKGNSKVASGIWEREDNTAYIRLTLDTRYGNQKCETPYSMSGFDSRIEGLETITTDSIVNLNKDRKCIIDQTMPNSYNTDTIAVQKWLRLVHFSDLHGDTKRLNRIMQWCNEYSDYIDNIINTGDNVPNSYPNDNPFASVSDSKIVLQAIGNHDTARYFGSHNPKYNWHYYRGLPAYTKFIKPFITTTLHAGDLDPDTGEVLEEDLIIDNWGVTQPEGAEENGYTWYYKDYESGFRLIVLDSMNYSENGTQRTWYQSILADARSNNKHVITASHLCGMARHNIKTDFAPWGDSSGFTKYNTQDWDGTITENNHNLIFTDTQAFIDAGGHFVCHLVGHSHGDKIFYAGSQVDITESTATKQIVLMVDAACCTKNAKHGSCVRRASGRSQDSFNYIAINRSTQRIYVVKIGCDSNLAGQHVDWVCLDYSGTKVEQCQTVGNASYIAQEVIIDPDEDEPVPEPDPEEDDE